MTRSVVRRTECWDDGSCTTPVQCYLHGCPQEQRDDHIWLTFEGSAWAIQRIEWPIIHLWRGYMPNLEFNAVDMSNFNSDQYAELALAMMKGKS